MAAMAKILMISDARKSRRIEHRQVTYVAGSARAAADANLIATDAS
jgi:hypothetical protein